MGTDLNQTGTDLQSNGDRPSIKQGQTFNQTGTDLIIKRGTDLQSKQGQTFNQTGTDLQSNRDRPHNKWGQISIKRGQTP
ncbi:MAG: hypothetical protein LBQ77_01225 [Treponema sp.]|jgi:hypothetical protein|nr:hypothetical protein [Treponema sp.]